MTLFLQGKNVQKSYHAAFERQRLKHREVKSEYSLGDTNVFNVNTSLQHLILTFPVFKEGGDPLEWFRDCEEYFLNLEVSDRRRAAIAAINLSGVPRSWYKSFMIGKEQVT